MIKLLILDVDGTLSDGKITYNSQGEESKNFSVKDGLAIRSWIDLGFKVGIITGRQSSIVEKRAKELQISYLFQKCENKLEKVEEICKKEGLLLSNVCVFGDDLNDLAMIKKSGKSFCPKDSNPLIFPYVTKVLEKNGGDGAVAEGIFSLLEEKNLTEKCLDLWL